MAALGAVPRELEPLTGLKVVLAAPKPHPWLRSARSTGSTAWAWDSKKSFRSFPIVGVGLCLRRLARAARKRGCRRAVGKAEAHAEASEVLLVLGEGFCPWGEPGTEIMADGLGFHSPAKWTEAVNHLSAKLRGAVPGLEVRLVLEPEMVPDDLGKASLCACINVPRTLL